MATLLKGATLVDLEPAAVQVGDLRIDGDRIVDRASEIEPQLGDEVMSLSGKIVLPGLVSAQHHFPALLLRGWARGGDGFGAEQRARQRLGEVLDGDALEMAATAGSLEGLMAGTTTVFSVHDSTSVVKGSLARLAAGVQRVGLRSALAYQVSERTGALGREEALEENATFFAQARGRTRGALAMGSLAHVSDDGMASVKELHARLGALLIAPLAEDPREERECRERHGASPTERLVKHGLLGGKVALSEGVHLSWPELSELIGQGTWLVHAARSNMLSQAGLATAAKFGVRGCLGTDALELDVFAEAKAAALRSVDTGQPIDLLRFLSSGHRLASEVFGTTIGPLEAGAIADLLVLDYQPPTPLTAQTLSSHLLFGLSSGAVESVMVDGLWRSWKRKPLSVDAREIAQATRQTVEGVWRNMG